MIKGVIFFVAMFFSVVVFSDAYVVGSDLKKVRLYDAEYEEIDRIKKKKFIGLLSDIDLKGYSGPASKILSSDDGEGMFEVRLVGYEQSVWLEMLSVNVHPKKMIKCPDVVLGKSDLMIDASSVGFGGSCK